MGIFQPNRTLEKQLAKLQDDLEILRLKIETTPERDQELEERLHLVERELAEFRLDYHSLYEKVRTNLAKMAKRADRDESEDVGGDKLARFRRQLAERKLGRG